MKYEYLVGHFSAYASSATKEMWLNAAGESGYRLVKVLSDNHGSDLFMERTAFIPLNRGQEENG